MERFQPDLDRCSGRCGDPGSAAGTGGPGHETPPVRPGGESSSLPESSISEPASGEESSDPEQDESSESSSEASSQPEKTDKITITQAGEYAGIDPMKQVVIRAGRGDGPGYDHHRYLFIRMGSAAM